MAAYNPPIRIALFLGTDRHYDRKVLTGILAYAREKPDWRIIRSLGLPVIGRSFFGEIEADGVIVHSEPPEHVTTGPKAPKMVAVSENWTVPGLHTVVNDDPESGRMVARHFLEMGFRSFAFKGIRNKVFSKQRMAGYLAELKAAGHRDIPCLLLTRSYRHRQSAFFRIEKICSWLAPLPKPIAIMACHDEDALEVVEACSILNLSIPQEVAIAGVDNDPFQSEWTQPPLTSVEQATYRIGYEAAHRLDLLLQRNEPADPIMRVPPERLVVRASTEIEAVADPLVSRALGLIRSNIETVRTVKELAMLAGASRSLLDLRFQQCLGRTPFSEIQRHRMERARHLLSTTRWSLTDIAYACGFSDLKDFSIFFKRQSGQRPSAFRKAHLQGTD
jgi:LacI family transcriptional regulator